MKLVTTLSFTALWILLALSGCGGSADSTPKLELHPAGGKVTMDGKPLSGASVFLMPVGDTKGQVATGQTNDKGEFECTYPTGEKGAPAGKFAAIVSKLQTPDGGPIPEGKTAADVDAREIVPMKYRSSDNPVFTVMIPPGGQPSLLLELKSK